MHSYKVLHFCLPQDNNLGDQLAYQALPLCFAKYDALLEVDMVNLRHLINKGEFLDDKIDKYMDKYDLIAIGAGGLLLPFFINAIFKEPESWLKINIPLIFFGVGAIGEIARGSNYTAEDKDSYPHLACALKAATAVSIRDLRSYLLVSRLLNDSNEKIFLTGCPTAFCTAADSAVEANYNLGLNIPFVHGGCREYQQELVSVAELIVQNVPQIKWICHSTVEREYALKVRNQLKLKYDVVMPSTPEEIGREYASCKMTLVTKAHAGIFSLANNVPFAFLSYDMKCDALMEMIVDFPHQYLIHLDDIATINLPLTLSRVTDKVRKNDAVIKKSQSLLMQHFKMEFDAFVKCTLDACQKAS